MQKIKIKKQTASLWDWIDCFPHLSQDSLLWHSSSNNILEPSSSCVFCDTCQQQCCLWWASVAGSQQKTKRTHTSQPYLKRSDGRGCLKGSLILYWNDEQLHVADTDTFCRSQQDWVVLQQCGGMAASASVAIWRKSQTVWDAVPGGDCFVKPWLRATYVQGVNSLHVFH